MTHGRGWRLLLDDDNYDCGRLLGCGLHTPTDVRHGHVSAAREQRAVILSAAYHAHRERFVSKPPVPPKIPANSWINPAEEVETIAQQHLRTGASSRLTDSVARNLGAILVFVPIPCMCIEAAAALEVHLGCKVSHPVHLRRTSLSHIATLSARRQSYVLKGLPQFFAHEGYAVELLASFAPDSVPSPVLVRDGWWIGRAFPIADDLSLSRLFSTLSTIQGSSRAHLERFRALGVRTVEGSRLFERIVGSLGQAPPRARLRLGASEDRLLAALEKHDDSAIAHTIVHGDLNPENISMGPESTVIFDWTDIAIAHPFIDLARFSAHPGFSRAAQSYAEGWGVHVGRAELALAPIWGAAFQLWNYLELIDDVTRDGSALMNLTQHRDHWFRSLADELQVSP